MIFEHNGTKYKLDFRYNTYWRGRNTGWLLVPNEPPPKAGEPVPEQWKALWAIKGPPLLKRECVARLMVEDDQVWSSVEYADYDPDSGWIIKLMEGAASVEQQPGRKNDSWIKVKGRDLAMRRMMAPIGFIKIYSCTDAAHPCYVPDCKHPHQVIPNHRLPDVELRRAIWQAYRSMSVAPKQYYWRLLEVGETIRKGDEMFSTSYFDWQVVEDFMFGEIVTRSMTHPYRRKEFYHGKK